MSSTPWIFVVGAPRSGTSLLRRLISSHPALYISPELRIMELLLIAGVISTHGQLVEPASVNQAGLLRGRRFVEQLAKHQLAEKGKRRIGDKYPPYALSVPQLDKLFPGAQFIHIIRDGRDVVSSLARTRTTNRGWRRAPTVPPTAELVRDWVGFVSKARKDGRALSSRRYHELRYEQLLADPAPVMRRLLAFLGEPLTADVLRGAGEIRPGRSWRETLSPADWLAFHRDPSAESLLAELGYPPTPHPDDRNIEVEAGRRTASIDRIDARIADGEDIPALWSAAAEAVRDSDPREATRRDVRAIRGPAPDPAACKRLLGQPDAPSSVFAAINAVQLTDDPRMVAALHNWALGRGLDKTACNALFPSGPDATEAA